jgi:hypothetical protein
MRFGVVGTGAIVGNWSGSSLGAAKVENQAQAMGMRRKGAVSAGMPLDAGLVGAGSDSSQAFARNGLIR